MPEVLPLKKLRAIGMTAAALALVMAFRATAPADAIDDAVHIAAANSALSSIASGGDLRTQCFAAMIDLDDVSDVGRSPVWLGAAAKMTEQCVGPRTARGFYRRIALLSPTSDVIQHLATIENAVTTTSQLTIAGSWKGSDGAILTFTNPDIYTIEGTARFADGKARVVFRGGSDNNFEYGAKYSYVVGEGEVVFSPASSTCPSGAVPFPAYMWLTYSGPLPDGAGHWYNVDTLHIATFSGLISWKASGCDATRSFTSPSEATFTQTS